MALPALQFVGLANLPDFVWNVTQDAAAFAIIMDQKDIQKKAEQNERTFTHDLYFATADEGDHVMLYKSLGANQYKTSKYYKTALTSAVAIKGKIIVNRGYMYFFLTEGTESGDVHLARFTPQSHYTALDIHVKIHGLRCDDIQAGNLFLCKSDLYFLKTKYSGTNLVEVSRWSFQSKYQQRDLLNVTPFDIPQPSWKGQWGVTWFGPSHTDNGKARKGACINRFESDFEGRIALHQSGNENIDQSGGGPISPSIGTYFSTADLDQGTFYCTTNQKLYWVKTRGVQNQETNAEVHMTNFHDARDFRGEGYGVVTGFNAYIATTGTLCLDTY